MCFYKVSIVRQYLYYSRINSLLDRDGLQIIYDWKHKLFVVISVI